MLLDQAAFMPWICHGPVAPPPCGVRAERGTVNAVLGGPNPHPKEPILKKTERARDLGWRGRIIELPVLPKVNFDWNHGNLDLRVSEGYAAATAVLAK
jgi:hypothetical protein